MQYGDDPEVEPGQVAMPSSPGQHCQVRWLIAGPAPE
jgi:hypothetical protein